MSKCGKTRGIRTGDVTTGRLCLVIPPWRDMLRRAFLILFSLAAIGSAGIWGASHIPGAVRWSWYGERVAVLCYPQGEFTGLSARYLWGDHTLRVFVVKGDLQVVWSSIVDRSVPVRALNLSFAGFLIERRLEGPLLAFDRLGPEKMRDEEARRAFSSQVRRAFRIPVWAVCLGFSAYPSTILGLHIRRWRRRRRGLCINCGYDLTGNVSGVCPECGSSASGGTCSPAGASDG